MRWFRSVVVWFWPLLQITAAATVAWVVARTLGDHPDPFFAPIAAIVALSSPLGERGRNAIRLVLGVIIGIVVGELTVWILGGGYGRLALATIVAMATAKALGGSRLVIVQAAAGAVLTVAAAGGNVGIDRLVDALIGAGVALVGSQFVFSPEPVALVRRAEATALRTMGSALQHTADALIADDTAQSERSLDELRRLRDDLTELARLRTAGRHVARHSVVWRHRRTPVVEETENAGQLDLLGVSCLSLARAAMGIQSTDCSKLVPHIREFADILISVGEDPGDRARRQRAADRAVQLAADATPGVPGRAAQLEGALMAMRLALGDLLVFAGVDPVAARAAIEAGSGVFDVRQPPPRVRFGFSGLPRRPRR